MAAVLDALAPYVKKLITDMAEKEVSMLLGVFAEIKKLEKNIVTLEDFVADTERRRIDDAGVQRWVCKLKGAFYEATDILELCQLDADERRVHKKGKGCGSCWTSMENKAPGCLLPLLFCLRNPTWAHGMGGRIKELNADLERIRNEMVEFNFQKLAPYQLHRAPSEATPHNRVTTSLLDESAVVGDAIKADTRALVQELLARPDNGPAPARGGGATAAAIKVVSITGPGGMGKSTLAKNIFNDKDIREEFRSFVWLSITESYDPEKLLKSAITQARRHSGGNDSEPHGDQQVLTYTLASSLPSMGKFLLVLDDVWGKTPWTDILQSPVLEAGRTQPGSRVIITTRGEHLVKDMGTTYYQHRVKPLSNEDAWSLLKKQLLPQDVGDDGSLDHLYDIGMGIIRNCDGLPLAIKAIGGLLSTKTASEHEWKGVLYDPAWKTDKAHHDLNTALRLSYDDLSPQLKQCFLYCSLFPKGTIIEEQIVIGMWMSEGFLKVPPGIVKRQKEVEDIGMDYYKELITRNLIEPEEMFKDQSLSKMHDVVRSFSQYMAKEEALVIRLHDISYLGSSPKFRRLSIRSGDSKLESVALQDCSNILEKQELLRSLIICSRMKFWPSTSDSSLSMFPSLRVLFVRHAESDMFIKKTLGKMKHLRFLHLESTDISRLPDDMDKLKFLEHIDINDCATFDGQIPNSILKLEHLRYLNIAKSTKFTVPKGFGGLTNLRRLAVFPAQMDGGWCSLQELGPLSRLWRLEVGCLEVVTSGSMAAKAKICDKVQLRSLSLLCYKSREVPSSNEVAMEDRHRLEEVFDQLCPPPQLHVLTIRNYIGYRPPGWMCMNREVEFHSLVGLDIVGLPFCTQLPDSLCKLPCLEHLVIDNALAIRRVGPEFQWPSSSSSSSRRLARASFPRPQFLRFKELPKWEEWDWEEETDAIAMPSLQTLYIKQSKLGHLPAGLASSRRLALRKLVLYDLANITVVENFPSVVMLHVRRCPSLKIIRGFPKMQSVTIGSCSVLEVLEGGQALNTVELQDPNMETFPDYLRGLKPRILRVRCHQKLRNLLSLSVSHASSAHGVAETDKINWSPSRILWACHKKLRNLLLLSSSNDSSAEYQAEMDKVERCGKVIVL